ncbi:MAG: hypothetical protein KBE40_08925 [Bacteroidales bacterium]|nr:hypothetical protein [Bacteroidales bacterium]
MKTEIQIKVHNGTEKKSAVYVLSRGQNSGKPLANPCPNCHAIQAPAERLAEGRAVAHILFISGKLNPLLRGSVIEFVTVKAYRKAFLKLWHSLSAEKISQAAAQLAALEAYAATVQAQFATLRQLRKSIAFAALE